MPLIPEPSNISIPRDIVRNANVWAPSRPCESETLRLGSSEIHLNKFSREVSTRTTEDRNINHDFASVFNKPDSNLRKTTYDIKSDFRAIG
jgi:hypothetical protein